MLTEIRLPGPLADACGHEVLDLDVRTPRDAVHAIICQWPKTRPVFEAYHWRIATAQGVLVADSQLDGVPTGGSLEFYVVPEAAGNSGIGKIFAGIFLVAISLFAPGAIGALGIAALTPGAIGITGALIGITGLAQVITPHLQSDYADQEEQKPSFLFNSGPVNTVAEGHPVPLVYGRMRVGSAVASAGFQTTQRGADPTNPNIIPVRAGGTGDESVSSVSIVRILDVISEGECEELVATYVDGALADTDQVEIESRMGLPWEDPAQQATTVVSGVERSLLGPTGPVTKTPGVSALTISDDSVGFARVTIGVPALYTIRNDERVAREVKFQITVKESGGSAVAQQFGETRDVSTPSEPFTPSGTSTFRVVRYGAVTFNTAGPRPEEMQFRFRWRTGGGAWAEGEWITAIQVLRPLILRGQWAASVQLDSGRISPGSAAIWEWDIEYRFPSNSGYVTPDLTWSKVNQVLNVRNPVDTITLFGPIADAAYQLDYDVPLPAGGDPWEVNVVRVTDDDPAGETQFASSIYWRSTTYTTADEFEYPDTAYAAVSYDAQFTSSRIVPRQYELKGIKVEVPTGYSSVARTYPTTWAGTWDATKVWSDNPAFILRDLLMHPRYGMGLSSDQIDGPTLYQCARYCDDSGLDPDDTSLQYGWLPTHEEDAPGNQPRFTFNGIINTHEEPLKILTAVASAARMQIWWGADGKVYFTQDRPADPVRLFSKANIIGDFNYNGTSIKSRSGIVNMSWLDKDSNYEKAVYPVESVAMIQRYGADKREDIVAYGKTNVWETVRAARWRLDTLENQADAVTFRVSIQDVAIAPGDVISIYDEDYADTPRYGGRLKTVFTSGFMVLDDDITLDVGGVYTISVQMPDDTVETTSIVNSSPPTTSPVVTLSPALTTGTPIPPAMWGISEINLEPRQFRVLAASDVGDGELEITAAFHDPDKYARIEYGQEPISVRNYIATSTGLIDEPSSISVQTYVTRGAGLTIFANAFWGWPDSADSRVAFYEYRYREEDGVWSETKLTSQTTAEATGLTNGLTYEFAVRALDSVLAQKSPWKTSLVIVNPAIEPPDDVTGFAGGTGLIIGTTDYDLRWDPNDDVDIWRYEIRGTSTSPTGDRWGIGSLIGYVEHPEQLTSETLVKYTAYAKRTCTYMIKAVDLTGTKSENHVSVPISLTLSPGVLGTLSMDSTWAGSHTQTVISGGTDLRLDQTGGLYYAFGEFTSTVAMDIGAPAATATLSANIVGTGLRASYPMSAWVPLSAAVPLTGNAEYGFETILEIRTSDDNSATPAAASWTVWRPFRNESVTFRHLEARVKLFSDDGGTTSPNITAVTIWAD